MLSARSKKLYRFSGTKLSITASMDAGTATPKAQVTSANPQDTVAQVSYGRAKCVAIDTQNRDDHDELRDHSMFYVTFFALYICY